MFAWRHCPLAKPYIDWTLFCCVLLLIAPLAWANMEYGPFTEFSFLDSNETVNGWLDQSEVLSECRNLLSKNTYALLLLSMSLDSLLIWVMYLFVLIAELPVFSPFAQSVFGMIPESVWEVIFQPAAPMDFGPESGTEWQYQIIRACWIGAIWITGFGVLRRLRCMPAWMLMHLFLMASLLGFIFLIIMQPY